MSDRRVRIVAAVVSPFVFVAVAVWWGGNLRDLQRQMSTTFQVGWGPLAASIDCLLGAAAGLALFGLCRWAHSRLVALGYLLVGGLLVFDAPLMWTYGAQINGAPPVAPAPIVTLLNEIFVRLELGPGQAVQIIAAAMLLGGLVEIARTLPTRGESRHSTSAAPPVAR